MRKARLGNEGIILNIKPVNIIDYTFEHAYIIKTLVTQLSHRSVQFTPIT